MGKYLKIVSFLFLTLKIAIIGQEFDTSIIKDASYCAPQDTEDPNIIIFYYYTFDGNYIAKVVYDRRNFSNFSSFTKELSKTEDKLDKTAPKPCPVYYKIEYYDRYEDKDHNYWIIYFFDKNEHCLSSYGYVNKGKLIRRTKEEFMIDHATGTVYKEGEKMPVNRLLECLSINNYYQFPINKLVFARAYPDFPLNLSIVQENNALEITGGIYTISSQATFLGKYKRN